MTVSGAVITYLGFVQPLSKAIHRYLATFLCHQALLSSAVPVRLLALSAAGLLS